MAGWDVIDWAIKTITDQSNIFDTDLKNSIFNNITVEDAYYKGEKFFKQFEEFNEIVEVKNAPPPTTKTKDVYKFPEIDFDYLWRSLYAFIKLFSSNPIGNNRLKIQFNDYRMYLLK